MRMYSGTGRGKSVAASAQTVNEKTMQRESKKQRNFFKKSTPFPKQYNTKNKREQYKILVAKMEKKVYN